MKDETFEDLFAYWEEQRFEDLKYGNRYAKTIAINKANKKASKKDSKQKKAK